MARSVHVTESWESIKLSEVKLTVRTYNCLDRMGLITLGDLARTSETDLLHQPNFGKKCLSEVRKVLSSIKISTHRMLEEELLDFKKIEEPLLSALLQPLTRLKLSNRAIKVTNILGIRTAGELIQFNENQLQRTPNVGETTMANFREALAEYDLSLGTSIKNWPSREELGVILESRMQSPFKRDQDAVEKSKFLEEELCAAVKMSVKEDEYAIIMRLTGWDGEKIWTLDALGKNPTVSGRTSAVSRERIRQVKVNGLKNIRRKAWSMPILKRSILLINENAPVAAEDVQKLLENHRLSRSNLGIDAVSSAAEVFQENWCLVNESVGKMDFVLPSDKAKLIKLIWTKMVEKADHQDFVLIDEIANTNQHVTDSKINYIFLGVSKIPHLEWLDGDRRIFWSLDRVRRDWNKTVNVCRKILTVAPEVPLAQLASATKRARTVTTFPTIEAFTNMLHAIDDIVVCGGVVLQGQNFVSNFLSKSDQIMIAAAKSTGIVATFSELCEAIVQQGLSQKYAQILVVKTPLWLPMSRGKYRFVAGKTQLDKLASATVPDDEQAQDMD